MQDIISELQDLRYLNWAKIRKSSGTAGSYLKAYSDYAGRKTYYKLSYFDRFSGIIGHESVNELIVDRLLSILGIDHLHYQLIHSMITLEEKEYTTYLCASQDFKRPGDSKLALDTFYDLEHLRGETPIDFCVRIGFSDTIYTMLIIDYLIMNRDRHGANIEVIKNSFDGSLRLAPLYDHGVSLLFLCRDSDSVNAFDPSVDLPVQSFIGSHSAYDNLSLIPDDKLRLAGKLRVSDKDFIFEGLEEILSNELIDKIWDVIWTRWRRYEDLCNYRCE